MPEINFSETVNKFYDMEKACKKLSTKKIIVKLKKLMCLIAFKNNCDYRIMVYIPLKNYNDTNYFQSYHQL